MIALSTPLRAMVNKNVGTPLVSDGTGEYQCVQFKRYARSNRRIMIVDI